MPPVRSFVAASTLATLGLMAAIAHAAPVSPGWYLGVDAGRSELKPELREPVLQAEESDTAFALHGGYRFTRHLAVEASYADLGNFEFTLGCPADSSCVPEAYPYHVDASIERLDLALLGIAPFGERAEVYAKVGVAQTQVDGTASSLWIGSRRHSSDSVDAVYGMGLRVHLNAPWSLRLQWERSSADLPSMDGADVDSLWMGAEYRFSR